MGSNPIWTVDGGIGEVVNTLVCGSSMRGFDSHIPPHNGGLAQLGEHLPYKQGVTGSNPVSSIFKRSYGVGVITPACHAGDRRFKSG